MMNLARSRALYFRRMKQINVDLASSFLQAFISRIFLHSGKMTKWQFVLVRVNVTYRMECVSNTRCEGVASCLWLMNGAPHTRDYYGRL